MLIVIIHPSSSAETLLPQGTGFPLRKLIRSGSEDGSSEERFLIF
jgi:hypothetical protein